MASLPIIAMTANTMAGDREEYLEAGMNDYVAKPIDFHMLMRKIEKYIGDRDTAELLSALTARAKSPRRRGLAGSSPSQPLSP